MRFRIIIVFLIALSVCVPTSGQGPIVEQKKSRKSVGLVLSGGGAKGVAHISAIKALEEAGIPIDYIAGTSMGAVIGGLYAIGYDTHTLDSMVRTQDWDMLIYDHVSRTDLSLGAKEHDGKYLVTVEIGPGNKVQLPSGLIGGHNVYNFLYELTLGYHDSLNFLDFPIPFTCVGYDMVTGNSVPLQSGSLSECIRASMSIPGAFQTVVIDSMVLVDGGIGNNFPADIVKNMGAEIIIGIDVTSPLKTMNQLNSVADIFDQITSFSALDTYNKNLEIIDLYVHPDIEGYSAVSFSPNAIDTLLHRGQVAMYEKRDEIMALKEKIGIPSEYKPEPRQPIEVNPLISIGEIHFEGLQSENEKVLRRIIGIKENSVIHAGSLRQALNKLSGTKSLTDVQYRLDGDSIYTVTFTVEEKHRNTISAGLRFDTEEMAAILLNIRYGTKNMTNSYFDLTGRLGMNPYGKLSFIYGNETQRKFNSSFTFRSNNLNLYSHGTKIANLDYNQSTIDLNFSNIRIRNFMVALGLRYDYYDYRSLISNDKINRHTLSEGLLSYYVMTHYESLDSRYYPRSGNSIFASYMISTSNFVEYRNGPPFGAVQLNYMSAFSINRVTFIPGLFGRVLIGNNIAYASNNFMGGPIAGRYMPHQMSFTGLYKMEQFEKSVIGASFEMRVRMWMKAFISLKASYAKQHNDFIQILKGENIFGIGVNYSYDSFIGPIDFLVDWSNYDKKFGFYFNLGYYF